MSVDILTERLRKSASFCFLFNNLKKIAGHLALISKLGWNFSIAHSFEIRYLVTGMVESPILIEPYFDFSLYVFANELAIDVERSKFPVKILERLGGFPEDI